MGMMDKFKRLVMVVEVDWLIEVEEKLSEEEVMEIVEESVREGNYVVKEVIEREVDDE